MPIQILPPQLANQIAAGEVVERPASVVKELVENSLDAGATRIQIDIENGGATLIRIRDNGLGIPKEELSLALARHATSKISSIEDLEAILSLGFRGEALASISSVSRLTLTSRTAEQTEAWQVFTQGREQESIIKPASHPVGTTVEVANLFFNTPARRKFLRTDKTEFAHIDEVIRRIALAKPQIAFTLTHNDKTVRQYKSAVEKSQVLKRIAAICGEDFIRHALHIDWKHDDLHLSGWVATPNFSRSQNDLSYCYINGRMVRDKVITHAIRQAYAEFLGTEQYPAFVLFLDLNPNEVDVNVHPTKHEVRFQQARLIHDFIFQGVNHALCNADQLNFADTDLAQETEETQIHEPQPGYNPTTNYSAQPKPNRSAAGQNRFASLSKESEKQDFTPKFSSHIEPAKVSKTEQRLYGELIRPAVSTQSIENGEKTEIIATQESTPSAMLRALALVKNQALLLQQEDAFYLLPLTALQKVRCKLQLNPQHSVPLLIPLVFRFNAEQQAMWQIQKTFFAECGFDFVENSTQQRLTLNAVPQILRQQNLQHLVITLLNQSFDKTADFATALCEQLTYTDIITLAGAVNLLQETEQLLSKQQQIQLADLWIEVNLMRFLSEAQ
ncbi:MAG: DNA mismatch repair endonuclease MutL [Lonepinella koalarum]|nr:DNA mismatch repair endonuclease MutL [Lonepinella koalarum]